MSGLTPEQDFLLLNLGEAFLARLTSTTTYCFWYGTYIIRMTFQKHYAETELSLGIFVLLFSVSAVITL